LNKITKVLIVVSLLMAAIALVHHLPSFDALLRKIHGR
jgi:nitrogen fixation-related uncharacterized protein